MYQCSYQLPLTTVCQWSRKIFILTTIVLCFHTQQNQTVISVVRNSEFGKYKNLIYSYSLACSQKANMQRNYLGHCVPQPPNLCDICQYVVMGHCLEILVLRNFPNLCDWFFTMWPCGISGAWFLCCSELV